jgi:cyclopropane fatty-acyl-phospholipid synthase-like methyltransferase
MKQYSQACDENKVPILGIIKEAFANAHSILEIGSGTGQHAVYFARRLPHLTWQPSDLPEHQASINAWRNEAGLENLLAPIELDVTATTWPDAHYDGLFSANTTHIMSWKAVRCMFNGIGNLLQTDARFCLYGPFNYGGFYTSHSNQQFDTWLKDRDPASGIRDFEALAELAADNGLTLEADNEMPVNNRLLVWKKGSTPD